MSVRKLLINYGSIIVFFIIMAVVSPADTGGFGLLSIIPAIFLMFYILYTKRVMEALLLGSLLGFVMAKK